MARNLQVNEEVLVPRSRVGLTLDGASAFHATRVLAVEDRSIEVALPEGRTTRIASSAVLRSLGILVLRVGDFDTEHVLLDPLAKSILQFCRLLVSDDMVRLRQVRSSEELARYWAVEHAGYTHVVLIGHGRPDAINFGVNGWRGPAQVAEALTIPGVEPKTFVSLACQTGYAGFARPFSESAISEAFIAPFHSVHGAVASQFCQTFLAYNLLSGETPRVAFRHARAGVAGSTSLRLWVNGRLLSGPT